MMEIIECSLKPKSSFNRNCREHLNGVDASENFYVRTGSIDRFEHGELRLI